MAKALKANADPFSSLLEWRNTPSSQLHKSPVEILFGRRTRTRLPIADKQLMTDAAPKAAAHLEQAKQRQAAYYNRTARTTERETLPVGKVVRFKHDDDWRKARVAKVLPNRAYEVRLEDGTTRRRTSRHVRPSRESFTERPINVDESTAEPATHPAAHLPQSTERQTKTEPYVTRSGRTVKVPARYKD